MVGSEVLKQCLANDKIASVVTVGRRRTGIAHLKLTEIEHHNFLDYSALEDRFSQVDVCFFCLGVYQNKVPKKDFWEITVDYPQNLIRAFERANKNVTFCLFGAQGASTSEKSPFRFAKAKGRAENILLASALSGKYVFRPGFIVPGPGKKNAVSYGKLFEPIYRLFPGIGIDAPDLARVMIDVGMNGHSLNVFENRDIRAFETRGLTGRFNCVRRASASKQPPTVRGELAVAAGSFAFQKIKLFCSEPLDLEIAPLGKNKIVFD